MSSQDVRKFTLVSYRTSALWGRCPALTPLPQLITPSRAPGSLDSWMTSCVCVCWSGEVELRVERPCPPVLQGNCDPSSQAYYDTLQATVEFASQVSFKNIKVIYSLKLFLIQKNFWYIVWPNFAWNYKVFLILQQKFYGLLSKCFHQCLWICMKNKIIKKPKTYATKKVNHLSANIFLFS